MSKRVHKERPDDLVRLHVAEPAPIGLFGLAIGCLILMCVDFELTSGKLMLIPWIFLLPASLQLIAGVFDFLRHNVFGGTAFIGYAMYWYGLSWVYYLEIQFASETEENLDLWLPDQPTIRQHTGVMSCGYLIFSVILTTISVGVNRILLSILLAIDFAFLMIILHTFYPDTIPAYAIGITLVLVFITSLYGFVAILILKVAGGEVLPIGRPYIQWSDYIIIDGKRSKSFINYKPKSKEKDDDDHSDFHASHSHFSSDNEHEMEIAIAAKSGSQIHKYGTSSPLNGIKSRKKSKPKTDSNGYVAMGKIQTKTPTAQSMDVVLQPTTTTDGGV